jgi:single-stranded-DNA-specific exonuclease
MKYNLPDKKFQIENLTTKEQILINRGILNPYEYLSKDKQIQSFEDLENIELATRTILTAIEGNENILILMDVDTDGLSSASIFFSYLKKNFPEIRLTCIFHNEVKAHGIDKDVFQQCINRKCDLLLVPDAGSNDIEIGKKLKDNGITVVVSDHHQIDKTSNDMIIVNPYLSPKYLNKALSGTGVTYQLMKSIDSTIWGDDADNYLDMVAFSIISDSMDIRELENRAILDRGLSNIKNKALQAFIDKAEYGDKKIESPIDFSFFVIPLINAAIRSGTKEEIEMMFRAFTEQYEEFDYVKRDKTEIKEDIYTRVVRLCTNNKGRQDRAVEKALAKIREDIEKNKWDENKILFARCDDLDKAFTGLVAVKLANEYNKPCVLLRKGETGKTYSGSIRNFNDSPLKDMKAFLQSLNTAKFIQGHANAAGCMYFTDQLQKTIELSNRKLENFDFSKTYNVDFEFDMSSFEDDPHNMEVIASILSMRKLWGMSIAEPLLLLENVIIDSRKISFMGEKRDTWKVSLDNGEELIKFKCNEDDLISKNFRDGDSWSEKRVIINAIVKVGKSSFNGEEKVQYVIQDYDLV